MKKKLLITFATVAALFCLCGASANAMDVIQTNHNVNMRTGPSTSYDVLTVVPVGQSVYVEEKDPSGWWQVDYGNYSGWVYSQYLGAYTPSNSGNAVATGTTAHSILYDANLRSGPGTGYSVYVVLPAGSTVDVESVSNGWAYLYYGNYAGYVSTSLISGYGSATTTTSNTYNGGSAASGTTWYGGHNYANVYDYRFYASQYPDLVAVLGTNPNALIAHFVTSGMSEGRQGISSFNVYTYRDEHPDLQARFGDDLRSYYLYACGIA